MDGVQEATPQPDPDILADPSDAGQLAELRAVNERLLLVSLREQELLAAARHEALHDGLTGLPNRALFYDRLRLAVHAAHREESALALLFVDLDGFKAINDRAGHQVGDLLLQQVAGRLRGTLRESDTAARLGGDEFGVLLPEPGERASVLLVARRILDALAPPCVIHGLPHRVGASIGVALYPQHGTDADTLLHRADTAMYTAKQTRGTVVIAALAPPHDAPAPAVAARRPPSPMEMVTGAPGPGAGVVARDLNERLLIAGLREQALAEQLRRQLAFTTAITANLGEGICALDPEGRITFVNPEAARLLGWPAADLPGQRLHDLVQHGCGDDCPLADALRAGMSVRIDDDRFARRDGTRLPVAYSVSPIVADGLGVGAVVAFRDITGAKRADERQRFLAEAGAALAESLDSATTLAKVVQLAVPGLADWCFVDVLEDGRVERLAVAHADPARAPLAGEVRRFPARPEGHLRHAPSLALAGGQVVFLPTLAEDDVRAMAQDDAHLRALLAIGPRSLIAAPLVAHGRPLGVLTFIATPESGRHFDIDDLALAEELARRCALALANAHLYRREQEAVHLREQFLTIAAHELRTPITTVRGYADLLRRQLDRPVPDRARVDLYLDQCDDGVRRMDLLIGNLLDVARSQQGQLVLQRAPVRPGGARAGSARARHGVPGTHVGAYRDPGRPGGAHRKMGSRPPRSGADQPRLQCPQVLTGGRGGTACHPGRCAGARGHHGD